MLVGAERAAALEIAASALNRRGHEVAFSRAGFESLADVDAYDLMVLEPEQHNPNALVFLGKLREVSTIPLMVLVPMTARGQGIHALELGADSFLVLPFDRRELVARSEALIRRYRQDFSSSTDMISDERGQ